MRTPIVFALLLAACSSSQGGAGGGPDTTTGTSTTTTTSTGLPACSWPANLDPPPDGGPWAWSVGRFYLHCKDGPDSVLCISDDPTTCPGPNAVPGGTISDCVDQCKPTEYAVSAGGPPQEGPDGGFTNPPEPDLPAACTTAGITPAGVAFYCCPCE